MGPKYHRVPLHKAEAERERLRQKEMRQCDQQRLRPGCWGSPGTGEDKESMFPRASRRMWPCRHFDLGLLLLISDCSLEHCERVSKYCFKVPNLW